MSQNRIVWGTLFAPPGGGGEEIFLELLNWGIEKGYYIYWLCFKTFQNQIFDKLKIQKINSKNNTGKGTIIYVPGGFNEENLEYWLKLISPKIVHHQGSHKDEFFNICKKLHIPLISGYHFWMGCINLSPRYGNREILTHSNTHSINSNFKTFLNDKNCHVYVCSEFIKKVISNVTKGKINMDDKDICNPISNPKRYHINDKQENNFEKPFITLINIHKLKGGEIFLNLILQLKNISFWGIQTEGGSEELDLKIKNALESRTPNEAQCRYSKRISDPKIIYSQTRILLVPSLVDETFCRVIVEALSNGIPIITTGKGNISNLISETCSITIPVDKNSWIEPVKKLYTRKELYLSYSNGAFEQYKTFPSFDDSCQKVFNIIENTLKYHQIDCIMLFGPFGTQGLGIQILNYFKIFEKAKIETCIFSHHSYWTIEKDNKYQKEEKEWDHPQIYYSPNDREHVLNEEIISFVKKYNVTKCIIPETCWFRIFQIVSLLKSLNVSVYAIPNIETIRKDEIWKHKVFDKILCNNDACFKLFKKFEFDNLSLIKYSIPSQFKEKQFKGAIKFMCLGGNNGFSRKRIDKVLRAFKKACVMKKKLLPKIELTITLQICSKKQDEFLKTFDNESEITIIKDILSNSEILNLYYTHHVNIQCSEQEGLGIGFYESLSTGTPCLTINTSPHNEIIQNNICGKIIPCTFQELKDNPDSFIKKGVFEENDLTRAILDLSISYEKIENLCKTTREYYEKKVNFETFSQCFIKEFK